MIDDALNELQQQIALGFDMEAWKGSPVGRFFQERAQEDILNGLQLLKNVSPFDHAKITELQIGIRSAEHLFVWMAEAIHAGKSALQTAEEILNEQQDPT